MANDGNVLFLCTGNSARSILAEALFNARAKGGLRAYSAGSHPAGKVRPEALRYLAEAGIVTEGLRSKSWDEFSVAGASEMNYIFTVCDRAAHEVCPVWTGQPMTAHWGVADPAAVVGSSEQIARAFQNTAVLLGRRIDLFLSLPIATLQQMDLQQKIVEIGQS